VGMEANRPSENSWKNISLFLLTLGILILCGRLIYPFLPALTGAVVLATVTARPYDLLKNRIGNPTLAAVLMLVAVLVVIILPVSMVVTGISRHVTAVVTVARNGSAQRSAEGLLDRHPKVAELVNEAVDRIDLEQSTQTATRVATTWFGGLLSNSLKAVIQIAIMLFILFFLTRDRQQALAGLRSLLPLEDREVDYLLARVTDTIYATVLGRLVVASVQATLAGLAYWALGVPGAFLWAMLTLALSCIPGLGAFLVWLPIAIYLGISDHWVKAIIMAAWGGLVVSTIDNVLYPALVGSRLQLHTVPIFLSVLGGIAIFGVPGLVLGPLLLTIALSLLQIWKLRAKPGGPDGYRDSSPAI
jgi:predicted PurR-regulated permease PerM